jgi:RNA polymerase sigma factor (sigma-70 family)
MWDDAELLRQYVQAGSEDAFTELVHRHLPVVYSSALRQAGGDVDLAKDICQTVFIDLGRKARSLLGHELLIGWLFTATRFTTARMLRADRRRQARESVAVSMRGSSAEPPVEHPQLASALDAAMAELAPEDRNAILLRFFQDKPLKDVGSALGINEDAARMRVSRALDKLHGILEQRGVTLSAAALGTALATEAVVAVPAGLGASVAANACASAAAVGGGVAVCTLKYLASTKAKILVAGAAAALVVGLLLLSVVPNSAVGRLQDGTRVMLEKVDYGTTYSPPEPVLAKLLSLVSTNWLRSIHWHPGFGHGGTADREIFAFWLKFSSKAAAGQSIGYALADESGFEAGMVFGGVYGNYEPSAFGTSWVGLVRGAGLFPRRSKNLRLRLYQPDGTGKMVRVAEFPVRNPGFRKEPTWIPEPLPIRRQTNGLVLTLTKATVGIPPPGPVIAPYSLQVGEWSEFHFRVTQECKPAVGWTIKEMWISDAIGKPVRVSGEDNSSFNGQFNRTDGDEIVCLHRWDFWSEEPAWKFRVHFEHPDKPGYWVEYLVRPEFRSLAQ